MSEWYEEYQSVSKADQPAARAGQPAAKDEPSRPKLSWEEFSKGLAREIQQGLSFGYADEIEAFLATALPKPLGTGRTYSEEMAGIKGEMGRFRSAHPNLALTAEIGSSIAMPASIPKKMSQKVLAGLGGGALYGSGVAEGGIEERAKGALAGGAFGAVLPFVGAGASEGAKRLMDAGVSLTPGQAGSGMVGKAIRGVEEAVSTVPIAGAPIKAARMETLRQFGTATFNEALEPILSLGAKRVPMTKTPRQASIAAAEQIDKAYKATYARLTEPVSLADMNRAIDQAREMGLDQLGDKGWDALSKQLKSIVSRRSKDGTFTGESWKDAHSTIRDLGIKKKGATLNDVSLAQGEVIQSITDNIFDVMAQKNPQVAPDIKRLGKSYRMFSTLDELVRKKDIEEAGTFMPSQLVSAVRRDPYASKTQQRQLEAPLQKIARAGQDILPPQMGSSGTAERQAILRNLGMMTGAGAVGAGMTYDPQLTMYGLGGLGAVGAGNLLMYNPYTRPFSRFASTAAGRAVSTPAAAGLLGQEFLGD